MDVTSEKLLHQSIEGHAGNRSSRPEVFCEKGVHRNFAKFTGKGLCQSLFFNKVAGLRLRPEACELCEFLRTPFIIEHLRWLLLKQ